MKQIWIQDGNVFTKGSGTTVALPNGPSKGVYEVQLSMTGFYLMKISEDFHFEGKVYGICDNFIDYVLKTYNSTSGNLGILLNGVKGTGKSFTAKEICNKLELPVIIVKNIGDAVDKMINWLSSQINFNCVFFFDEYEKEFQESSKILSFMDGVYNSDYRKTFILTTNSLNINDNLIGRPSRIRYCKTFGNLPEEICRDICNDILINKEATNVLIDLTRQMSIVTIDLVKALANEINIHGVDSIDIIRETFNIEFAKYSYSYYKFLSRGEHVETTDFINKLVNAAKTFRSINKKPISERTQEESDTLSAIQKNYTYSRDYNDNSCKFDTLKIGDKFIEGNIVYIDHIEKIACVVDSYYGILTVYAITNIYKQTASNFMSLIV